MALLLLFSKCSSVLIICLLFHYISICFMFYVYFVTYIKCCRTEMCWCLCHCKKKKKNFFTLYFFFSFLPHKDKDVGYRAAPLEQMELLFLDGKEGLSVRSELRENSVIDNLKLFLFHNIKMSQCVIWPQSTFCFCTAPPWSRSFEGAKKMKNRFFTHTHAFVITYYQMFVLVFLKLPRSHVTF